MKDWISTADSLPDEGVTVDTCINDKGGFRNHQKLKRRGRMWYFEDDSMYVYYRPTHWRHL